MNPYLGWQIVVRWHGVLWNCRLDPQGYRCGHCGRGNLHGLGRRLLRHCRVCKAAVVLAWPTTCYRCGAACGLTHPLLKGSLYYCDPCWAAVQKLIDDGITGRRHSDGT